MQGTAHKIKELSELASILGRERAAGKRLICWHGMFDLLDLGQIRQLEAAKALGDLLIVSVIPDRYMYTDEAHPEFSEKLRAEAVAALQMVDYINISAAASAAPMIRLLKPHVYVQDFDGSGGPYESDSGMTIEAEAIQSVGGTLQFASNLGARMSSIASRLWSPMSGEVGVWLDKFRQHHDADEIINALKSLEPLRVLVVGEVILDEYVYCEALGKSSKEPILALRYLSQDVHAGGSIAIANHLADFCKEAKLVAYLGSVNSREEFVRASMKANVHASFIRKADSPTIVKRRFVEKYLVTKLLEIYEINDELLNKKEEKELCAKLAHLLPQCDVVIVGDFGHGLIPPRAADMLSEMSPFLAINTQINAANSGFHTISKYKRADYICIHEGEIRLDSRSRKADLHILIAELANRLSCDTVMVTRGKDGTLLYRRDSGFSSCPALAVKVVDRLGAGDAVLAITALCAAKRLPPDMIGFIGNLVGAQAVRIVGNSRSIDRAELLRNVQTLLR